MNSDKPVALVTGAATGIGRSAALALARNGYDVVINFSRSEEAAKTTAQDAEAAGAQPLAYAASKAAVANLTKTLANALGPEIRVNAVAPGWIEGDWMKRTLGENYEGLMARRARYTPLKRCCTPEDVAETMLSLIVSNRFVTGEIIIDGGFSSTT